MAPTVGEVVFVDTNVLLSATDESHAHSMAAPFLSPWYIRPGGPARELRRMRAHSACGAESVVACSNATA